MNIKGLPLAHIISDPTVDDLDNDNVTMFDRAPLLQQRFQNDHIRGIIAMQKEIKKIATKLTETKQQFDEAQKELQSIRAERAKVCLQKHTGALKTNWTKRLNDLDEKIRLLDNAVRFAPDVIKELERQLTEAKQKYAAEAREELLIKQQQDANEIVTLSKELVELLDKATRVNDQLFAAYDRHNALQKSTGENLIPVKACEPSRQMLKLVSETLHSECYEGKHTRRILAGEVPYI